MRVYDYVMTVRGTGNFLTIIRFFRAASERHKSEILVIIGICAGRMISQEVLAQARQFALGISSPDNELLIICTKTHFFSPIRDNTRTS